MLFPLNWHLSQGCHTLSIIVHYFSTSSYLVCFRHFFCSFKQKRKTILYKSCKLFGNFSIFFNFFQLFGKFSTLWKNFQLFGKFSTLWKFSNFLEIFNFLPFLQFFGKFSTFWKIFNLLEIFQLFGNISTFWKISKFQEI